MKETESLRELDAFCSEKVMGYREHDREQGTWHDANGALFGFHPTINTADAFLVLEKCAGQCGVTVFDSTVSQVTRYTVGCVGCESLKVQAETLPLAIVKFAKQLFADKDKP